MSSSLVKIFIIALGTTLTVVGCVQQQAGRFEAGRFQHNHHPYALFYAKGGTPRAPLGPSWRVDNYTSDATGAFVPKHGPLYEDTLTYDVDDDGKSDLTRRDARYDLLLEHTAKQATLWIRTLPLSARDQDKELDGLAERYVEAAARAGSLSPAFGAGRPQAAARNERASRILAKRECAASSKGAFRIDFELADVATAQLSASARWTRASVVLVRTGYSERLTPVGKPAVDQPVLMLIGFSAKPVDYEALAPDFDLLLQKTILGEPGGGLAMHGDNTCTSTAASAGGSAPSGSAPANPANAPDAEVDPESLLVPMPPEEDKPAP